jgi:hypothetical protein
MLYAAKPGLEKSCLAPGWWGAHKFVYCLIRLNEKLKMLLNLCGFHRYLVNEQEQPAFQPKSTVATHRLGGSMTWAHWVTSRFRRSRDRILWKTYPFCAFFSLEISALGFWMPQFLSRSEGMNLKTAILAPKTLPDNSGLKGAVHNLVWDFRVGLDWLDDSLGFWCFLFTSVNSSSKASWKIEFRQLRPLWEAEGTEAMFNQCRILSSVWGGTLAS